MTSELLVSRNDGVTHVTLNRADKHNALSDTLTGALLEAVVAAGNDGTRLLVLSGNGKSFCAGFDFTGIESLSDGDLALRLIRVELLLQAVYHAPFSTLALVQGAAYGAGADLVAACHRRVAAPGTRFRMPGLRFGIALGTRRLARLIGPDRARTLLETTRVFDAEEAVSLGFLSQIAPESGWPDIVTDSAAKAKDLAGSAQTALLELTTVDTRDGDLAALARSAAEPGLKDRIAGFLAASARR